MRGRSCRCNTKRLKLQRTTCPLISPHSFTNMQSANGTERHLRDILFRKFDKMYHCLMIKSRRLRKINPNQVHPLPCSMYPTYPSPGTKRILLQQNKTDDKQPRQTLALIINGNCGGNSYISAQLILLYFAPFLEKVLDVQWLLQWMVWPLLATDISRQSAPQRKAAWKRIFSLISFSAERFFFVV